MALDPVRWVEAVGNYGGGWPTPDMQRNATAPVSVSRHPASARFHEILGELAIMHDLKQKDYGRDDDPFANIRASTEWGVSGWAGAMIRATDKLRRLQVYATRGTLANEGARDSFMDLAVYAIIALVLWEQEQNDPQRS